MTDPVTLAATAVTLLTPYLSEGGKEVVKTAAKDLYGYLKGKLTGPAAEALGDLEAAPENPDNQGDLRKRLAKAIEADPKLGEELRRRVAEAEAAGVTMQALNQSGSTNAKAAQVSGDRNTVTIG